MAASRRAAGVIAGFPGGRPVEESAEVIVRTATIGKDGPTGGSFQEDDRRPPGGAGRTGARKGCGPCAAGFRHGSALVSGSGCPSGRTGPYDTLMLVQRRIPLGRVSVSLTLIALVAVVAALSLVVSAGPRGSRGTDSETGPFPRDFVDIHDVPRSTPPAAGDGAAIGTFTEECGRNAEGHRNADNLVASPRLANGAHHTHDYVGNLSTTAFSTDDDLAAAGTTCTDGDRSTYFWPVLRRQDRPTTPTPGVTDAHHGNIGQILPPADVSVQFRGNPTTHVVPMPRFLRTMTGDPVAGTVGLALAHAQWGCAGFPDRFTMEYPRCPDGRVTRTFDWPSCWNGIDTDSGNHRTHIVFPAANGLCPSGTFPVPQLRVVVSYDVPRGAPIAVDAFSEQQHNPVTDHAGFVDVLTTGQMTKVVSCLNEGRHC